MAWGITEQQSRGPHQTAKGVEQPDRVTFRGDPNPVINIRLGRIIPAPARRRAGAGEPRVLASRGWRYAGTICPTNGFTVALRRETRAAVPKTPGAVRVKGPAPFNTEVGRVAGTTSKLPIVTGEITLIEEYSLAGEPQVRASDSAANIF